MKTIDVDFMGTIVELQEGDRLDMERRGKNYKIKLTKITDNFVDLLASDTGKFDEESRTYIDEPIFRFQRVVKDKLAWMYIVNVVRDGKTIDIFHPY